MGDVEGGWWGRGGSNEEDLMVGWRGAANEERWWGEGRMIRNDDDILHEEEFGGECGGSMLVCGDGEAVQHSVAGVRIGVVAHLGAVGPHGRVCVDIWL